MGNVFTPMNATGTKRLKYKMSDVEVVEGSLNTRKRGCKATVRIKGKKYKVIGIACGLPHCMCDAKIVPLES